jgi:hypothetical protein
MTDDNSTDLPDDDEGSTPGSIKFEAATSIGDVYFQYSSWSAWSISPDIKRIAPITRVSIGDLDGNILFDRSVVITGLADLLSEISNTLELELTKLTKMPDYVFHIPGTSAAFIENIEATESCLTQIKEMIKSTKLLQGQED